MKILIPKQPRADKFHHTNDSFRSILSCWKENGWIDLEETDNPYVWINKVGDILLYDRPLCNTEWLLPFTTYRIALFGNEMPQPHYLNCSNWIFWARHPKTVEEFSKKKIPWEDRNTKTIFIGNIENDVQQKYRSSEWKEEVEFFLSRLEKITSTHKKNIWKKFNKVVLVYACEDMVQNVIVKWNIWHLVLFQLLQIMYVFSILTN